MKRVRHATSAASSANALLGERVAVDADQQAGRAEAVGDQARVAAGAERAVDGDLARLRVERLDQLAGQDRDVRARHVKQDGQRMRCGQPPCAVRSAL